MQKQLTEVLKAAFDDESFREELLSDHNAALKSRDWELSPDHKQKLDDFMSGAQVANPDTILRAFSSAAKGDSPWEPPPWGKMEDFEST